MQVCATETMGQDTSACRIGASLKLDLLTRDLLENPRKPVCTIETIGTQCVVPCELPKPAEIEAELFGETIDRLARELGLGGGLCDIAVVFSEQVLQERPLHVLGFLVT